MAGLLITVKPPEGLDLKTGRVKNENASMKTTVNSEVVGVVGKSCTTVLRNYQQNVSGRVVGEGLTEAYYGDAVELPQFNSNAFGEF